MKPRKSLMKMILTLSLLITILLPTISNAGSSPAITVNGKKIHADDFTGYLWYGYHDTWTEQWQGCYNADGTPADGLGIGNQANKTKTYDRGRPETTPASSHLAEIELDASMFSNGIEAIVPLSTSKYLFTKKEYF